MKKTRLHNENSRSMQKLIFCTQLKWGLTQIFQDTEYKAFNSSWNYK